MPGGRAVRSPRTFAMSFGPMVWPCASGTAAARYSPWTWTIAGIYTVQGDGAVQRTPTEVLPQAFAPLGGKASGGAQAARFSRGSIAPTETLIWPGRPPACTVRNWVTAWRSAPWSWRAGADWAN